MVNNEGKACDAVIRLLEQRTGETRADIRRPETDAVGPKVELRLRLGTQEYAIEHTQIEAFEGQIRTGEEFEQLIGPVIDELSGTLPGPAVYDVHFPIDTRLNVKAAAIGGVRRGLIEWVREAAQGLHESNPERPTRERNPRGFRKSTSGVPPSFSYEVTLQRWAHWSLSQRHDGVLTAARITPDEVEPLRANRLRRALCRKCPKLQRCKGEGARSVLVLEDNDIALTNHFLVGDQLAGLLEERADVPDEIYLVATGLEQWEVRPMKYDNECWPMEGLAEFYRDGLIALTT